MLSPSAQEPLFPPDVRSRQGMVDLCHTPGLLATLWASLTEEPDPYNRLDSTSTVLSSAHLSVFRPFVVFLSTSWFLLLRRQEPRVPPPAPFPRRPPYVSIGRSRSFPRTLNPSVRVHHASIDDNRPAIPLRPPLCHFAVHHPGEVPGSEGEREGAETGIRLPHAFRALREEVSREFHRPHVSHAVPGRKIDEQIPAITLTNVPPLRPRFGRTPRSASRLVQAMSAWSVKTRSAPFRQCRDARVYGLTTTVSHD